MASAFHSAVQLARFCLCVMTLAFVLLPQIGDAKPAPGGAVIRNVAETTYFHTSLGIVERVFSNPVVAEVAIVNAIRVEGFSELLLPRGAFGYYFFEVENVGNVPLDAAFSVSDTEGADRISRQVLVPDFNGNGRIDANERQYDPSTPWPLQPGEKLHLIYEFRVSERSEIGTKFKSVLTAQTSVPDLIATANGSATIVSGSLALQKEQTVRNVEDATELSYLLRLRNNSEQAIAGYSNIEGDLIEIDGGSSQGVLVRDAIPLNTVLQGITETAGLTALYHVQGTPPQSYVTQAPQDLETVDAVAFFHAGDYKPGTSSDVAFTVRVPHVLGTLDVQNTATTYQAVDGVVQAIQSNTTEHSVEADIANRLYFMDPQNGWEIAFGTLLSDSQVGLIAGSCNVTPNIDQSPITVRSAMTGDVEIVMAIETGPNTGIFVTPPFPLAEMDQPVAGDGVLATTSGDRLEALSECAGVRATDDLLVNPGNHVFDAVTNAPIAGVTVALLDAVSGIERQRVQTNERGFFVIGEAPAGRYRYRIIGAPDWSFPSVRQAFPGMGRRVTEAAYGAPFQHEGGVITLTDLPLDPFYSMPLTLSKSADREVVSYGEFATYTLSFTNNMRQALQTAEIADAPPVGASFVPGSAVLDGRPIADPSQSGANDLIFDLGTLEPLKSYELRYVMRFSPAAREGRNENAAVLTGRQAGTGTVQQSPTARALVEVNNSGGVFARQGTVIGSVFLDCDRNGVRNGPNEPGIPGVRIVTQEGLSVVTDIDGKYSLPGLRPVTHAFVVQHETLPAETSVTATRTNDLRRGGSRLIPLKRGELRAEHFAVIACHPDVLKEVEQRRGYFKQSHGPNTVTSSDLPLTQQRVAQKSSRSEAGIATTTQLTPQAVEQHQEKLLEESTVANRAAAKQRRQPLEGMIRSLDNALGFLDLESGQVVSKRTQTIRIKGKADLQLSLIHNGQALSSDRVGARSTWARNNVQALEFVAVRLARGENTLRIVGKDSFGIVRASKEIRLVAPGKPSRVELALPQTAPANPAASVPVVVRLLDANGLPVPASGTVTLSARRALWDVTDIRDGTPGVQAFVDNGEATFNLIPPQIAGPDRITVSGAFGKTEATITFTPDLDARILVGVIEGAVSLGGDTGAVLEPDRFSAFEDTLTGVRGEIYLKGVIRGDALLTLRYSSDRDTEDRLFRDIRGDEYYPVYGDNSERGADAQSSSNLYVKVEKGRSYILYGDIAVEPESSAFKLAGPRRVATGAKAHWENDKVSVTVFGMRTNQTQAIKEFRGRGVSGPYDLDLTGYAQGSERVEILVRDEEGGDILTSAQLRRGTDYILDFFRNTITFNTPVRQLDADGNPVSVRVTYEVETEGAEKFWLYGGEVNYAASDNTTVGARIVHADAERGNAARQRYQSAYVRHIDGIGGEWEAELGRSEDAQSVSDTAARLSYSFLSYQHDFAFEAIHAGRNYLADGSVAQAGTTQVRLRYGYKIDKRSDILLSAEYVRDRINASEKTRVDALYSRQFSKRFRGDLGVELQRTRYTDRTERDTSLVLGAHWTPRDRTGSVIKAKLRYPLGRSDKPATLTLGLYQEPKPGWQVYNEVELSFGDDQSITRARLGFSYELNDWLSGHTEFEEGVNTRETTFHQGLAASWNVTRATVLNARIEHSQKMETGEDRLTSVALGAKWGSGQGRWVGDADFDTTFEESGKTHYASVGFAGQVTEDLTFLGRSRIAIDRRNGADHRRMRTRAGLAYRPMNDPRLEVLAWYEHRLEQKQNRSETHLWSVDATYEVDENLRLNAKYAGQKQKITINGDLPDVQTASAGSLTQLVQAGVHFEFADDRMQAGINAIHLWDDLGNRTNGLGAELGFSPRAGTLIAVGYNKASKRIAGQGDLFQEGLYLRFNILLDHSLWDRLNNFLGT